MLTDRSSGHERKRENGLDAKAMGKYWGGKGYKMRKTIVPETGPFPSTYHVGQEQSLQFSEDDDGPFYLKPRKRRNTKHPIVTEKVITRSKTKPELLSELRDAGFAIKGKYTMREMKNQAVRFNIPLEKTENYVQPGWVGQNKGLLQVLWERGFINEREVKKYRLEAQDIHKDEFGTIKQEYLPYLLRELMANCSDFKNEKSAMEHLCEQLSSKGDNSISIVPTPKYHCELAGEGIEYGWGYSKKVYRSIPYEEKNTREKFEEGVRYSLKQVTKRHINLFSAKCRRYMLAYMHDAKETEHGESKLTYSGIEKFTKTFKCHRNTADQDKAFITKVWKESCGYE